MKLKQTSRHKISTFFACALSSLLLSCGGTTPSTSNSVAADSAVADSNQALAVASDSTEYIFIVNNVANTIYTYPLVANGAVSSVAINQTTRIASSIDGMVVSPNQKWLLIISTIDNLVKSFAIGSNGTLTQKSSLTMSGYDHSTVYPTGIVISPDSNYAYVAGGNGQLFMFQINEDGIIREVASKGPVMGGDPLYTIAMGANQNLVYAGSLAGVQPYQISFNPPSIKALDAYIGSTVIEKGVSGVDLGAHALAMNSTSSRPALYELTRSFYDYMTINDVPSYLNKSILKNLAIDDTGAITGGVQYSGATPSALSTYSELYYCNALNCNNVFKLSPDNSELFAISEDYDLYMLSIYTNGTFYTPSIIKHDSTAKYRTMVVDPDNKYLFTLAAEKSSLYLKAFSIDKANRGLIPLEYVNVLIPVEVGGTHKETDPNSCRKEPNMMPPYVPAFIEVCDKMIVPDASSSFNIAIARIIRQQMITPQANATNVPINTKIQIQFSNSTNVANLTSTNFKLTDTTSNAPIAFNTPECNTSTLICTLTPTVNLNIETNISVAVSGDSIQDMSWTFTTSGSIAAPVLISPSSGQLDELPLNQTFVVDFPLDVNLTTANASTMQLFHLVNGQEPQLVAWDYNSVSCSGNECHAKAPNLLQYGQPYKLVISGVKTTDNLSVPSESFNFTARPRTQPVLLSPAGDDLTNVPYESSSTFSIRFSKYVDKSKIKLYPDPNSELYELCTHPLGLSNVCLYPLTSSVQWTEDNVMTFTLYNGLINEAYENPNYAMFPNQQYVFDALNVADSDGGTEIPLSVPFTTAKVPSAIHFINPRPGEKVSIMDPAINIAYNGTIDTSNFDATNAITLKDSARGTIIPTTTSIVGESAGERNKLTRTVLNPSKTLSANKTYTIQVNSIPLVGGGSTGNTYMQFTTKESSLVTKQAVAIAVKTTRDVNADSGLVVFLAHSPSQTQSSDGYSGGLGGVVGSDALCNSDRLRPEPAAGKCHGSCNFKSLLGSNERYACIHDELGQVKCGNGYSRDWPLLANTNYSVQYEDVKITPNSLSKNASTASTKLHYLAKTNEDAVFSGYLHSPFTLNYAYQPWIGVNGDWTTNAATCNSWNSSADLSGAYISSITALNVDTLLTSWPYPDKCSIKHAIICVEQP